MAEEPNNADRFSFVSIFGLLLIAALIFGAMKLFGAVSGWWSGGEIETSAIQKDDLAVAYLLPEEEDSRGVLAIGGEDQAFVCRAAIASIMGRSIVSISVVANNDEEFLLEYTRSSDNTKWSQVCKIEGRKVIWASFENGNRGRWRDDPRDELIEYDLRDDGVKIVQVFGDGSSMSDEYERE